MARTAVIISLLTLAFARAAAAQEKGQAGLVIGYPAAVGFIWHASEHVAVRPDVSLLRSSSETTTLSNLSGTTSPSTAWTAAFGLSALFFVHRRDALRVYLSPRFAYARTEVSTTNTTTSFGGSTTTTTENVAATYTGVGSIGAQYSLNRRFSVFGEVGVAYIDTETSTRFPGTRLEGTSKTVSTRSGVGVVLYF